MPKRASYTKKAQKAYYERNKEKINANAKAKREAKKLEREQNHDAKL